MKEKISKELNKISNMNKDQKWDYFKSYYLLKTIAIIIGTILLVWFVKDTFLQKKIANAGCVYGVELSEDEKQILTNGYLQYYNIDPKKYVAYISTDNMFEGTEQKMDASTHEMALIAQCAAGEIFYLILDKENLDMFASGDVYLSLDDAFINGFPENAKKSVVYLKEPSTGENYPAAIDLSKAGILSGKEGYLVFTIGIPDAEYPERLFSYLSDR